MQKWEYLVIMLKDWKGGFKIHTINGEIPRDWNWDEPGLPVHTLLNNFGEEGWELVSRAYMQDELVFKRLRADGSESRTTRLPDYPGP